MKKIKFSKTFSFILLFTLFLIFLSYYVNRSTEETLENISYTYILGLYFFGLGTCLPICIFSFIICSDFITYIGGTDQSSHWRQYQ